MCCRAVAVGGGAERRAAEARPRQARPSLPSLGPSELAEVRSWRRSGEIRFADFEEWWKVASLRPSGGGGGASSGAAQRNEVRDLLRIVPASATERCGVARQGAAGSKASLGSAIALALTESDSAK